MIDLFCTTLFYEILKASKLQPSDGLQGHKPEGNTVDKSHADMLVFVLIMLGLPTLSVVSYVLTMWWSNRQNKRPKPKKPTAEEIRVITPEEARDLAVEARIRTTQPLDTAGLT